MIETDYRITPDVRSKLIKLADALVDQLENIIDEDEGVEEALEDAMSTLPQFQEWVETGNDAAQVAFESECHKELRRLLRNNLDPSEGTVWVLTCLFEDACVDQEIFDENPTTGEGTILEGLNEALTRPAEDYDIHGELLGYFVREGNINGGDSIMLAARSRGGRGRHFGLGGINYQGINDQEWGS